jgi:hypothetical protein
MPKPDVVLELFGEGKTDIGASEGIPVRPTSGVLPRLLHSLCGKPPELMVKRRAVSFLQGKGWVQKVQFAKRQAFYNKSAGLAFVMDTEGDQKQRMRDLTDGMNAELPNFPMVVGAPHPCVEVWLLADPAAIKKGMNLPQRPQVPDNLESLPAPSKNPDYNPKTILAKCCNASHGDLKAKEKDSIAAEIRDLGRLREQCPTSFAPFAEQVERIIRPLF